MQKKNSGCLKSFSTFCRITPKAGLETGIIFKNETLSEVKLNSCDRMGFFFPEVSLNDGIMFINGSVLNASSRVIGFASNVENN